MTYDDWNPHWITARFAGLDVNWVPFGKGERVFYVPAGQRIYAGAAGRDAARRFENGTVERDENRNNRPYWSNFGTGRNFVAPVADMKRRRAIFARQWKARSK